MAPRELLDIALDAHLVICADVATLEHRLEGLDAIGVHLAIYVSLEATAHGGVRGQPLR